MRDMEYAAMLRLSGLFVHPLTVLEFNEVRKMKVVDIFMIAEAQIGAEYARLKQMEQNG